MPTSSISLDLVLSAISPGAERPKDVPLFGRNVADKFAAESSGRIVLRPVEGAPVNTAVVEPGLGALVDTIQKLTTNVGRPVKKVAVVFADRWAPQNSLLGVMVDSDLDPWDAEAIGVSDLHPDDNNLPREGCAVFLKALVDSGFVSDAYVHRTTLHELGHVFNLPHDEVGATLMTQTDKALSASAFERFATNHQRFLATAPDQYVRPGERPFGERGGHLSGGAGVGDRTSRSSQLRLSCRLPRERYLPGEPIILDVRLAPISGTTRTVSVLDELDPGYDRFRIWIERPDGERRRFRPLAQFCGGGVRVMLRPKADGLSNNVSLFWGRGGFTFGSPGWYRVWCEFRCRADAKTSLRSNAVEVEIAALERCTQNQRHIADAYRSRAVARYLYFRGQRGSPNAESVLQHLVDRVGARSPHGAFASYVISRSRVARQLRLSNNALDGLRAAADSPHIGPNSRRTARRILSGELSEQRAYLA